MRPCVVIQSNIFNKYSPTIIVVPLTSNSAKIFPSEFLIKASKTN
ncbi:MAG: type II toxin-antitoxin system PemK/MazF family toxin [Patescibacteria group bacterium]